MLSGVVIGEAEDGDGGEAGGEEDVRLDGPVRLARQLRREAHRWDALTREEFVPLRMLCFFDAKGAEAGMSRLVQGVFCLLRFSESLVSKAAQTQVIRSQQGMHESRERFPAVPAEAQSPRKLS